VKNLFTTESTEGTEKNLLRNVSVRSDAAVANSSSRCIYLEAAISEKTDYTVMLLEKSNLCALRVLCGECFFRIRH
jgi:hypothetical protein